MGVKKRMAEKFNNGVSIEKVSVQYVAMFLMTVAGILATEKDYWMALAFAVIAAILIIVREFYSKRKY